MVSPVIFEAVQRVPGQAVRTFFIAKRARARETQLTAWSKPFSIRIELPRGRALGTLGDAARYIMKLKPAEKRLPHWQTAAETLLLVAERDGDTMLARIAMMQALNHGSDQAPVPRRKQTKANRIPR